MYTLRSLACHTRTIMLHLFTLSPSLILHCLKPSFWDILSSKNPSIVSETLPSPRKT
jgi:hypothetical protein